MSNKAQPLTFFDFNQFWQNVSSPNLTNVPCWSLEFFPDILKVKLGFLNDIDVRGFDLFKDVINELVNFLR